MSKTERKTISWSHGLAFRYGSYVLCGIFTVLLITFSYTYSYTYKILLGDAQQNAGNVTHLTISRIRQVLQPVEDVPEYTAKKLSDPGSDLPQILGSLREFVKMNKEVFGSCLAFEPGRSGTDHFYYAPYFYETPDTILTKDLAGPGYGYLKKDWYTRAMQSGKGVWSEPYFDYGGGYKLMCTYSVPFFREISGMKTFAGVVTMDISLTTLCKIVDSVHVYKSGFGFLLSQKGKFITFPDSSIVNKDIYSASKRFTSQAALGVLKKMTKGESGFVRLRSVFQNKPSWMYYAPVSRTGWSFGLVFPSADLFSAFTAFTSRLIIILGLSLLILFFVIILITRRLTRPLTTLAEATKVLGQGDFDITLPIYRRGDEISLLANSFSLMKEELKVYIEDLKETTSARKRMEGELMVAGSIQRGLLPSSFPRNQNLEIEARLVPAMLIGGDLYDFVVRQDKKVCFAIGDVSGKGVPASLFMAVTRTLFRSECSKSDSPDKIMKVINRELCKDNPGQMFVTFIIALANPETGSVTICNAGHNAPFVMKNDGIVQKLDYRGGIPLGIFEDAEYTMYDIKLDHEDCLFVYTDGVTEAADSLSQLYGESLLIRTLEHLTERNPEKIIQDILKSIGLFTQGVEQADDITLLVMKYKSGAGPDADESEMNFILENRIEELIRVVDFVESCSIKWRLSKRDTHEITLILEELISNIVNYAFDDNAVHMIHIRLSKMKDSLTIRVEDEGKPFNILETEKTIDKTQSADDRQIGGLGIHFVKSLVNHIAYSRNDAKNILILTRNLDYEIT